MKMRLGVVALVSLVLVVGCKGCGDNSSGEDNLRSLPAGCNDIDGDGFQRGADCEESVDCDDGDPTVNPDASEECDGVDNDCDGTTDEDCEASCTPGDSRVCSSDVGACTEGTQLCMGGSWGPCSGQEPVSETCNGEDDDCDGEVDETGDLLCDDGIACNGTETCEAGACATTGALDCSDLSGPCTIGQCSEKDGGCKAFPMENGSACEDGNFCTMTGTCNVGVCETAPRDCSSAGDACNIGVCDEAADACVPQPMSDGTACDDQAFCTVGDTCTAGVCGGAARDCASAADQCNAGACDEATDACVPAPLTDGTACDDGMYCNTGETCQAGTCTGGAARDCSASGGSCRTGSCNETTDSCDGPPVADGTPCDDSAYCTINDVCAAGVCTGGTARNCSSADGLCRVGTCNEALNQCIPTPAADGTACDDGVFCTVSTTCTAGACTGAPRDCSASADACNSGSCSEAVGACVPQPVSDGTACVDTLFCTANELCQAGSCTTMPTDCSAVADQCNTASCDDAADACVPVPIADGTACQDGEYCTQADSCTAGSCVPGVARDCSSATGGDTCLAAFCDEALDTCDASPIVPAPATCCNPAVDADLDGSNECDDCDDSNGAAYPGAMEFCNGFDDDCDGMIDEDFDSDMDGFSVCSTDPVVFDCDDNNPAINPGAMELCGPGNVGNGVDEDCDGYIDETCDCNAAVDADNDGVSECGDCDESDPNVYPGAPELCDGKDNDCNTLTTPNCGVSGQCNHDGDNDYSNDPDLCREDMICACEVNNSGSCTGNYFCTSFCNTSDTGPQGDGCTTSQSCQYDLLRSGAVHGCGERSDPPGTKLGGESCTKDADCRSLSCSTGGPPSSRRCQDYCGSDAYCPAPGVSCVLLNGRDGRCYDDATALTGSSVVGTACTSNTQCDHGFCATDPANGSRYCTEPCCSDADCQSGYTCSLRGNSTDTSYVVPTPGAPACTTAADCGPEEGDVCFNNACAFRLVETGTMCIKDQAGQGNRVAGQSCTTSSECASNFCEVDLGVCIDVCCSDSSCPAGLGCEFVRVETTSDRATSARVCLNLSTEDLVRRR